MRTRLDYSGRLGRRLGIRATGQEDGIQHSPGQYKP